MMNEKMHGKKGRSKHARAEMRSLKRGGAPKGVVAAEAAEYGMRNGGMVGCNGGGSRGKQDYGKR